MVVVVAMGIAIRMNEKKPIIKPSHIDPYACMRLWQLISPSLPIGTYAYSQGLETAIEKKWLTNEADVLDWIKGILQDSLAMLDAPILIRLYQAWQKKDELTLTQWNQFLLASRESNELYLEDQQMGRALWRLLKDLLFVDNTSHQSDQYYFNSVEQIEKPGFVLIYSLAAENWSIPIDDAIRGFLWSWCENQVAAAIKLVPLGQTAGQKILSSLIPSINESVLKSFELNDDEIGTLAPAFSIACAQHEVQYSRLFRS